MSKFSLWTSSYLTGGSVNGNTRAGGAAAFAGLAIFLGGCSSGPAPLALKLYNPETKQTLDCHAKDPTGRTDREVLASAVESCARQLEARGFVREK